MRTDSPIWLDESHPNFTRWQRARELSIERGKIVQSMINQVVKTIGLKILDLGSGEGGTPGVLSENNFVVSFDLSLVRLKRQKEYVISNESSKGKSLPIYENRFLSSFEMTNNNIPHSIELVNGNALQLPFSDNSFDLIIIQDVIEHLDNHQNFNDEIKRVLNKNGTIYLSTPNKLSIFNFISDPHFGLPIISVLKRNSIKKYFLKFFRKKDFYRSDVAELLSLKDIKTLFGNDFKIKLNSKFVVAELFNGNRGIVWSNFHLNLIGLCNKIKLYIIINKIANDKFGMLNKFFTPTFYMVLQKL